MYNSQTNQSLDDGGPIGVCHDVSVDIGGVDVEQHMFVVEHTNMIKAHRPRSCILNSAIWTSIVSSWHQIHQISLDSYPLEITQGWQSRSIQSRSN